MNRKLLLFFICFINVGASSCGEHFLSVKPDRAIRIPQSIADYQALLDHATLMNAPSCHELGIIGGDESYLLDGRWANLSRPYQRNAYVWAANVYEGQPVDDWDEAYERILQANMALEGVSSITPSVEDRQAWDNVKGSALFYRAWNHYQLAQLFCGVYNTTNTVTQLGIPLRLESDVTVTAKRATVEETYRSILDDLHGAMDLLPTAPVHKFRPSKGATYALLCRVYLQMEDYGASAKYGELCLKTFGALVDFNELDFSGSYTFDSDYGMSNPEVLFMCRLPAPTSMNLTRQNVDTTLLDMYAMDDLRRLAYFRTYTNGSIIFKGSYSGGSSFFTGLAIDEVYISLAESYARLGDRDRARDNVAKLLAHRYAVGASTPDETVDDDGLLAFILAERRKELIFRGTRWEDLRRLNKKAETAVDLRRKIDGLEFELPAGHPYWVWPIPDNVIDRSGMAQNER